MKKALTLPTTVLVLTMMLASLGISGTTNAYAFTNWGSVVAVPPVVQVGMVYLDASGAPLNGVCTPMPNNPIMANTQSDYIRNVLFKEWYSGWGLDSLKAGALAIKAYAWWNTLAWNASHGCAAVLQTDVDNSTDNQHYEPGSGNANADDVVWSTWGGRLYRSDNYAGQASIFEARYAGDGNLNETPCGSTSQGLPGTWNMSQNGSAGCSTAGHSYFQIVTSDYYTNLCPVVSVPCTSPVPAALENAGSIITNNSFEGSLAGWTIWGTFSNVNGAANSGNWYLAMTNNTGSPAALYQDTRYRALAGNSVIQFAALKCAPGGPDCSVTLCVQFDVQAYPSPPFEQFCKPLLVPATGQWGTYLQGAIPTTNHTNIRWLLWDNDSVEIGVDSVSLLP